MIAGFPFSGPVGGGPVSLPSGSTINGNLIVTGDVDCDTLDVAGRSDFRGMCVWPGSVDTARLGLLIGDLVEIQFDTVGVTGLTNPAFGGGRTFGQTAAGNVKTGEHGKAAVQGAAIANPTDLASCITALTALLAVERSKGRIAE